MVYASAMETQDCSVCRRPKGTLACGICLAPNCKKCVVKLEKDSFYFLPKIPLDLSHKFYCDSCYQAKVVPELENYNTNMAKAKNISVYVRGQGEETRFFKRKEKPITITDCSDKNETLLRMAFLAATENFNTLFDVSITLKKIRDEWYQTKTWSGTGIPTTITNR